MFLKSDVWSSRTAVNKDYTLYRYARSWSITMWLFMKMSVVMIQVPAIIHPSQPTQFYIRRTKALSSHLSLLKQHPLVIIQTRAAPRNIASLTSLTISLRSPLPTKTTPLPRLPIRPTLPNRCMKSIDVCGTSYSITWRTAVVSIPLEPRSVVIRTFVLLRRRRRVVSFVSGQSATYRA